MDQILKFSINYSSKLLLGVMALILFFGCKKEEKNVNLFEAEIDGTVYTLKREHLRIQEGEYVYTQGAFENDEILVVVGLDLCNLAPWAEQNRFPIFRDSCADKNGALSHTQVNLRYKTPPSMRVSYTTYNEIPDGFSEVVFEAFQVASIYDYNIKGTYRIRLARVENDPPNAPDSLLVTGRFHFRKIPRDPK
ncbi:MAG: hypothetical protein ACK417_08675 [Bacteroidia bacterium]